MLNPNEFGEKMDALIDAIPESGGTSATDIQNGISSLTTVENNIYNMQTLLLGYINQTLTDISNNILAGSKLNDLYDVIINENACSINGNLKYSKIGKVITVTGSINILDTIVPYIGSFFRIPDGGPLTAFVALARDNYSGDLLKFWVMGSGNVGIAENFIVGHSYSFSFSYITY